ANVADLPWWHTKSRQPQVPHTQGAKNGTRTHRKFLHRVVERFCVPDARAGSKIAVSVGTARRNGRWTRNHPLKSSERTAKSARKNPPRPEPRRGRVYSTTSKTWLRLNLTPQWRQALASGRTTPKHRGHSWSPRSSRSLSAMTRTITSPRMPSRKPSRAPHPAPHSFLLPTFIPMTPQITDAATVTRATNINT